MKNQDQKAILSSGNLTSIGCPVGVATHMRSGTHLVMDFIRWNFPSVRSWKYPLEANDRLYLALDVLGGIKASWGAKRAIEILRRGKRPLLKLHWTSPDLREVGERFPEFAEWLRPRVKWVHVVRDPYRVMASM